jgi:hypothetical protein
VTDSIVDGSLSPYKYPVIVGGYDDYHEVEGFEFDMNAHLVISVKTCSLALTDATTSEIRRYVAYLKSGEPEFSWFLQLPPSPFSEPSANCLGS